MSCAATIVQLRHACTGWSLCVLLHGAVEGRAQQNPPPELYSLTGAGMPKSLFPLLVFVPNTYVYCCIARPLQTGSTQSWSLLHSSPAEPAVLLRRRHMLSRLNSLAGQGASGSSSPATRSERLTAICTLATFLSYINFTSGSSGDCLACCEQVQRVFQSRHQCVAVLVALTMVAPQVGAFSFVVRRLHHSGSLMGACCA